MGKGGGHASAPQIQIPSGISGPGSYSGNVFDPLGRYSSQTLPSLLGLYNWASDIATGGNVAQPDWSPTPTGNLVLGHGNQTFAPFTGTGGTNPMLPGGGTGGGSNQSSILGPFLTGAEGGIGAETNLAQQFANLTNGGANIYNEGQGVFNQGVGAFNTGTQMLNRAMNKGLFPSQQAMIDQAVASQQAGVQQQLSSEGLGSSTVAQQLKGQIKLSGAAAAGQLIQGNMQLAESEQGLGLEGEQLGFQGAQLGAQINQTLFNEFGGIASQNAALQSQMWQEAMQGMGAYGTMLNATLQPFGYSLRSQEDVLQANMQEAGLQLQAQTAQNQASQAGFSSMMGGLGSLLGGQGGSGGLIGGLGSLFGSGIGGAGAGAFGTVGGLGAGAASAGAAGSLGTLGAGGGSAIIGAIGALFSVFCQVAITVYGFDDLRWVQFREYLLFRAPKPLRKAYVRNAAWFSRFIKPRPILKGVIKRFMDVAIWYDKATRTL